MTEKKVSSGKHKTHGNLNRYESRCPLFLGDTELGVVSFVLFRKYWHSSTAQDSPS